MKRILMALPLLLLLVSCGTSSNSSGGMSAKPTSLYVTRISLIPENGFAPFQETVKDAAMVQQLYTAALALPVTSARVVNRTCLNDLGLLYHLVFQPSTLASSQMELDPAGCQLLKIGGKKIDVRQMDQTFLTLFEKTIKVTWLNDPSL